MSSPPTANLAVKGIMNRLNPESQNARKPPSTYGFLAKSNTCSDQITAINEGLPNTSRATIGSSVGGSDLYNQSTGTSLSATVSNLPTDGRILYVRLWFLSGTTWISNDFVYFAAKGP